MTTYSIRATIAVPEAMVVQANHLARLLGHGETDDQTFGSEVYVDSNGGRYAVASTLATPTAMGMAVATNCPVPPGVDAAAVAATRAMLRIDQGPAAPGVIAVSCLGDVQAALAALGVAREEVEMGI